MPVFESNGSLFYFAHVPKTGGTSIELYLQKRFGALGFVAAKYKDPVPLDSWANTSPQHIETAVLNDLIRPEWFAASFAVVRDPVSRLQSAYKYKNRNKPGWLRPSFEAWVRRALRKAAANPRYKDNHLRPQSDLVPNAAEVFRLEDGLSKIIPYLDEVTMTKADDLTIPRANQSSQNVSAPSKVSPRTLDMILTFYTPDYDRFDYARPSHAAA